MATQEQLIQFAKKIAQDSEFKAIVADGIDKADVSKLLALAKKHGIEDVAGDELKKVLKNYTQVDQGFLGRLMKRFFG
ncbi:MAG: hypothetical protein K8I82_27310 [Anaerolineae bacterium]|nr:hypothetical protein [Anaerolineae bacterium]